MNAYRQLCQVVSEMPQGLAAAMLEGISRYPIIAGKYADPDGHGVCPMLAARRCGMPPQSQAPFAKAWDRYLQVKQSFYRKRNLEVRYAHPYQLHALRTILEARLFPAEELQASQIRCHECERPQQLDFHGHCAFCGAEEPLTVEHLLQQVHYEQAAYAQEVVST